MQLSEIVRHVNKTLVKARIKFPKWPVDMIHANAVANEENGELTRAVVQWNYEGGTLDEVVAESIHSIAMHVRFLQNIRQYEMFDKMVEEKKNDRTPSNTFRAINR